MMNIDAAVKLLSRLPIRDRDSGTVVPFRLNPNQQIAIDKLRERAKRGLPLWFISVKARRVGFSSLADGLGLCHALAQPLANAKIVAHLDETVDELFKVPLNLAQGLRVNVSPRLFLESTQQKITAVHPQGNSELSISTAGSVQGGRGGGASFLHLSEAAYYRGEGSFVSLLNSVPYHPNTIVCIESTANGKVGIGETFYRYWKEAEAGRNEYLPIFLSWLNDRACVRDAREAEDAPVDQDERDLIKHFNATRAQLAWRRWCIANKCNGYVETFYQEYPAFAEEAFVASGNPAFIKQEIAAARASVEEGRSMEWVKDETDLKRAFREGGTGALKFWERPALGEVYYIGADAARGTDDGDFAAATVINGSTNRVAATYADRVTPATFALLLNTLGRHFNKAMINIELTGGWGDWAQTLLRDKFHYPNFYLWKGLDDKIKQPKQRNMMGWTTTHRSREKLFTAFREAVREQELMVRDEQIVLQMESAERETGRWEVTRGHDDRLFSALLANIAVQHYPPTKRYQPANTHKKAEAEHDEEAARSSLQWKEGGPAIIQPDGMIVERQGEFLQAILAKHLRDVQLKVKRGDRPRPLEGI